MTVYQVGNFNLFIFVEANGFEIKTKKLNKKTQEEMYVFDGYFARINSLFAYLTQKVFALKAEADKNKPPGDLKTFESDYDEAIAFIKKLRDKYEIPMKRAQKPRY